MKKIFSSLTFNQAKYSNHIIKRKLHIYLLFLIFLLPFRNTAQVCRQRTFQGYYVASLGCVYHYKSHLGISVEAGIAPPSSHFVFTVKSTMWTERFKYESYREEKEVTLENFFTGSTVVLKTYYVPQAYTPIKEKWAFGCGAGLYISEFSKSTQPSLDISAAYLVKLRSQSCSDQRGYFRIEAGTLASTHFIKPFVNLNMFLLL